jgi:hypothetical protein
MFHQLINRQIARSSPADFLQGSTLNSILPVNLRGTVIMQHGAWPTHRGFTFLDLSPKQGPRRSLVLDELLSFRDKESIKEPVNSGKYAG